MQIDMNECPTPQKIAAFLLDELSPGENQIIALHVEQCATCEASMDNLVEDLALGESDATLQSKAASGGSNSNSVRGELVGRNLLFGLLALHNGFISRSQLVAATSDWLEDKTRPLVDILLGKSAISGDDAAIVTSLVNRHTEKSRRNRFLGDFEARATTAE
jgi:hypothetical protein